MPSLALRNAASIPEGTSNPGHAYYLLPRVQQDLVLLHMVADGFLDILSSHVSKQSW